MAGREESVIDASVAIKWFNLEEGTVEALKLRDSHIAGSVVLMAPDLFIYELGNALRFKPELDSGKVRRAINDLLDLQIDLISPNVDMLNEASKLAFKYGLTIYDSCYLAIGELMGINLVTADNKFYEKAKGSGHLQLLESRKQ